VADTKHIMAKQSQAKPADSREMITVYGKVTRELAERLDRLADERRWSRAQMVAYCIEQFVENAGKATKT
jgi:predicted transcriptional regulator